MSKEIIHLRIDVTKLKKEWLYKGEKGTYLDATLFFNSEKDQYENNGMIVQSVPADVYKKHKSLPKDEQPRGEILGNAKVFGKVGANLESSPGHTSASEVEDDGDDLPF